MPPLTADQIREILRLQPHPIEGGYFAETYQSELSLPGNVFGPAYSGARPIATAIFYLLTSETFSAMHKLPGDELFHFYLGDPVEMLQLSPDGSSEIITLGQDIASGMRLQYRVPGGYWQGSRLIRGGSYALMGTTMSPGFDYADYLVGERDELTRKYQERKDMIAALTR
ncbi:MAG TPA: cupin domain-containing protein [Candidatus Acidoferrales bacterium]|nr:cupin domain-containing protein [Candidatus Acidoferrales bacterium]